MPTTHKDLCRHAQGILQNYIQSPIIIGDTVADVKALKDAITKLIELFDGPMQREADATEPMTLQEFQQLSCRTLPEEGVQHWFRAKAIMAGMSADEYAKACAIFGTEIDLIHAVFGVAGEAGELIDPVKKSMFYGKPLDVENLKEEAGDLLWYIATALCRALNCTLEDLARANVAKLQKRYPEKYTDQAAIDRADKK